MNGLIIQYDFAGDEAEWEETVNQFLQELAGISELIQKFSYQVNRVPDSPKRIHIAKWVDNDTLSTLQSQQFFKDFAQKIQGFAGDTMSTQKLLPFKETIAIGG